MTSPLSPAIAQIHAQGQRAYLAGDTPTAIAQFERAAAMAEREGRWLVAKALRAGADQLRRDLEG